MNNKPFRKRRPKFGGKRPDFKNTLLFAKSVSEESPSEDISRTVLDTDRIKPSEYFWKGKLPKVDEKDIIEIECPDYSDIPTYADVSETVGESTEGKTEIVGVRFRAMGKVYYFLPYTPDAGGMVNSKIIHTKSGDNVIVDTARGVEIGTVFVPNKFIENEKLVPLQPMRSIIRLATEEDIAINRENREIEKNAEAIFVERVNAHSLPMKLIDIQYTFDRTKLLFYFSSEGRVDFRELVKDLASIFHTRIELRQIGIRDEARIMGGLGACGRPLCCSSFLTDFVQVSIKMAKSQVMSLNPSKISGCCGRLMCCLRYENDVYEDEISKTPSVDSVVKTEDGYGTVIEINPLAGLVKVKLVDNSNVQMAVYHRDSVEILDAKDAGYLAAVEKRRSAAAIMAAKAAERQQKATPAPSFTAPAEKIAASDTMFDEKSAKKPKPEKSDAEESTTSGATPTVTEKQTQKNRSNRRRKGNAQHQKSGVHEDVKSTEAKSEEIREDKKPKQKPEQSKPRKPRNGGNRQGGADKAAKPEQKPKAAEVVPAKQIEVKTSDGKPNDGKKPSGNYRRRHRNKNGQKPPKHSGE